MEEKKNNYQVEKEVEEEVVLPGFRFHPTDEELVGFYLRRKVENKRISIEIIKEIDIYKYDPWDLPKVSSVGGENMMECYFFCLRGRKYRNSIRPNRVTGSGFWKAMGIDRSIYSSEPNNNNCNIGLKKSLVYYRGSAGKGTKTDWMMHEFRLPSNTTKITTSPSMQEAEVWTICRIFKRKITWKKFTVQNSKQSSSSSTTTQQTTDYPTDSSSKASSFNSDTGDEYMYNMGCGASTLQQRESFINQNYIEEKSQSQSQSQRQSQSQIYGGQWINPTVVQYSPSQFTTTVPPRHRYHQYSSIVDGPIPSPINVNELLKEENWDEFGRMMDQYMMDTQDCGY